jgi:predicted O-methyltransferase YrrM
MIKKIIFLFKSETDIIIILLFLFQKIINIFNKNNIKKEKKFFLKLVSSLKISTEFFSVNAYNFYKHLSSLKSDFRYLEIGSFEGGSAIFVSEKFKKSRIFCVDNWIKTEDGYSNLNFNDVEKNFDFNVKDYQNILKIKKTSDDFFLENKENFDVIYVDGYHKSDQVFKDCVNSWKKLNVNGILICDDYIWSHYSEIKNNPCFGINKFLKTLNNKYKILQISNSQIFLRKI